jgi:[FeFe] hydrogenase H-cluster maturation GTPase HydF
MKTAKSLRLHLCLFGRRNTGKSSIVNAVTRQNVAIVSDIPGTTTDPVDKTMEMQPLGPVVFTDTAGLDDEGALGRLRVDKTRSVFDRADIGIIVTANSVWGEHEESILAELAERKTPVIVAFNKTDIAPADPKLVRDLESRGLVCVKTSAVEPGGTSDLRQAIVRVAPEEFVQAPPLIADLVGPGKTVMLVVPIDMEAPKGRLIAPQVHAIRELLDNDSLCYVVKERELKTALDSLREPPALVVTDSQAFLKVAADTPSDVPMTSFSILFARAKGDLVEFVRGAKAIDDLKPHSKVLVCEACAHHPIGDDIGRVKIPRWLRQYAGASLEFTHMQGHDFPADPTGYDLVVHCGGCAINRREVISRIMRCERAGVPITNYGICIARTLGVLDRALAPFPAAQSVYLRG